MKGSGQVIDYCYHLINKYNRDNNTNHSFCVEDYDGERVVIDIGEDGYEIKCKISVFIRQELIEGDVRRLMLRVEDKVEIKRLNDKINDFNELGFIGRIFYNSNNTV